MSSAEGVAVHGDLRETVLTPQAHWPSSSLECADSARLRFSAPAFSTPPYHPASVPIPMADFFKNVRLFISSPAFERCRESQISKCRICWYRFEKALDSISIVPALATHKTGHSDYRQGDRIRAVAIWIWLQCSTTVSRPVAGSGRRRPCKDSAMTAMFALPVRRPAIRQWSYQGRLP